jgi:hypothetical protein
MKPCTHYQETLLSDVHGELRPHERPEWEKHLEQCEPCRLEKERLVTMLSTVKATLSSSDKASDEAEGLPSAIRSAWREGLEKNPDRTPFWGTPLRFAPALAATCLVIALAGWFSFKEFRHAGIIQDGSQVVMEEQLASEDLEVVKNIELLEEMEDVEKLVELLDRPSYGDPSLQRRTKSQNGGAYA